MAEVEDIRKTGAVGLQGLKGLNQLYDEEPTFSPEEHAARSNAYRTATTGPVMANTGVLQSYEGTPMADWGRSGYDEDILNAPMSGGMLNDTRYENQPWYDVLANGVGKMLGTAATTFLSSLIGLPYGLACSYKSRPFKALE